MSSLTKFPKEWANFDLLEQQVLSIIMSNKKAIQILHEKLTIGEATDKIYKIYNASSYDDIREKQNNRLAIIKNKCQAKKLKVAIPSPSCYALPLPSCVGLTGYSLRSCRNKTAKEQCNYSSVNIAKRNQSEVFSNCMKANGWSYFDTRFNKGMFWDTLFNQVRKIYRSNKLKKDENGKKEFESNLKDSKKQGLHTERYKNGQKKIEGNYKDGKPHGLATWWHENGQIKAETNWKDGKKHGLWTKWHENGQKEIDGNYKDGKPHGLVTFWHENGQKKGKGNYKYGKPHGLVTAWNENGQKKGELCYKNGNKVNISQCVNIN